MTIHTRMTPLERVRQRPLEHLVAFTFTLAGLTRLLGSGPVVEQLTGVVAVAWSLVLLVAAGHIYTGLHWRGDPVMRGTIEMVGWYLGTAAVVGGPVILLLSGAGWSVLLLDDIALASASVLRVWYLHLEICAIRRLRKAQIASSLEEE